MSELSVIPFTLKQANDLVALLHRHHKPVRGHRFSIGLTLDGEAVGACIVGRPVARMTDQYNIAEVTRMVTNGVGNGCSKLYGAAARAAKAMGFKSIQTFTLPSESGISLRASGWTRVGSDRVHGPNGWSSRGGRRTDQPQGPKVKWSKELNN